MAQDVIVLVDYCSSESLCAIRMLNPREAFGDLDVTFVPQHSQSYEGLSPGAQSARARTSLASWSGYATSSS